MDSKHYTEVLIDGRIYTLGGYEDEGYMQRVASYINEMITTLKRQEGFSKQSAEYQTAMVELNMADDYFKARDHIAKLEQQKHEMEKEVYSLKHELVTTQMKLDAANRELEVIRYGNGYQEPGAGQAPEAAGRDSGSKKDRNHGSGGRRDSGRGRNPGSESGYIPENGTPEASESESR